MIACGEQGSVPLIEVVRISPESVVTEHDDDPVRVYVDDVVDGVEHEAIDEYRDHIPPFRTPIPNLWVASMFQVYPHDRGQNYSIDLAHRLVEALGGQEARG